MQPYPRNTEVNKFIDAVTDMKINATMSEVTKDAAKRIAGYLDFITGYWPDYERHILATVVTAEDLREASRDSDKGGKEWDYWPKEIQNKLVKHAQREHAQRIRTVQEMGAFLQRQQETMEKFSPEAAAAMERVQDGLAA
jgi:hypothetical protein